MIRETAYLILENGRIFKGQSFGAKGNVTGEIVFTTGMTGYLEILTDPSYYGQIILQTFPLIGNYGIIPTDFESKCIWASGYIVKEPCDMPSNFRSEGRLDDFLKQRGIVGICGIDTRALTKTIRENGVMNGIITSETPEKINFNNVKEYHIQNAVKKVSASKREFCKSENKKFTVALLDFGSKENIKRELIKRGCDVWVFPSESTVEEVLSVSPDGIMLSNGPGDPVENVEIIKNIKALLNKNIPLFGICLGHQLLALANGFKTEKLKYGHRGANQPAKDLSSGRIYVTSQNHGYAVLSESIDKNVADEWFINANDGTNEGIIYKNTPAFSVQFHPEACGGPLDTMFLFDRFITLMTRKV